MSNGKCLKMSSAINLHGALNVTYLGGNGHALKPTFSVHFSLYLTLRKLGEISADHFEMFLYCFVSRSI